MADPDDVGDIVICVERILQDEHLKGKIVRNGYKSVREKYNVRKHTDEICEIYSKVVNKFWMSKWYYPEDDYCVYF